MVQPSGAYHFTSFSGSVHALKTLSVLALKVCSMNTSLLLTRFSILLFFDFLLVLVFSFCCVCSFGFNSSIIYLRNFFNILRGYQFYSGEVSSRNFSNFSKRWFHNFLDSATQSLTSSNWASRTSQTCSRPFVVTETIPHSLRTLICLAIACLLMPKSSIIPARFCGPRDSFCIIILLVGSAIA